MRIDHVRDAARLLQAVAGVDANGAGRAVFSESGVSAYVQMATVTGTFFPGARRPGGSRAELGPADDVEGAELVVVISQGLWTRRYGRAPDVIGRALTVGDLRFAIVGVMPDIDYPLNVEMGAPHARPPRPVRLVMANRQQNDLVGAPTWCDDEAGRGRARRADAAARRRAVDRACGMLGVVVSWWRPRPTLCLPALQFLVTADMLLCAPAGRPLRRR